MEELILQLTMYFLNMYFNTNEFVDSLFFIRSKINIWSSIVNDFFVIALIFFHSGFKYVELRAGM